MNKIDFANKSIDMAHELKYVDHIHCGHSFCRYKVHCSSLSRNALAVPSIGMGRCSPTRSLCLGMHLQFLPLAWDDVA